MKVDIDNYQRLCETTENKDFESIQSRITPEVIRILHHAIGIATESGEILDQLKRHIFYGTDLDITNLVEECGDTLYYCAGICNCTDVAIQECMQTNHNKLFARYGEKFSEHSALNRDLEKEREILEYNDEFIDEDHPY